MPIKGLTDRNLAFPEIGQIRKGAKKEPNKPGADLTYFRVEFDEHEKKATENFRKIYGDKPVYIRVMFPFNEIERIWEAWYEAYTTGRMVARSDGEFITYQLDDKSNILVINGHDANGNRVPHPADGIAGRDYKGNPVKFKALGRLKIIVPELMRAAYLTVMTTSVHDIANISSQLGAFKELNNGQLAGIPFLLRRRPKLISTPSGEAGQRVRRKKYLISIEADPEWVKAKLGELHTLALPGSKQTLLPAGEFDDESIETEFDEDDYSEDVIDANGSNDEQPAIELFEPVKNKQAVNQAMKAWNISEKDAKFELERANLGQMTAEEFTIWLNGLKGWYYGVAAWCDIITP